MPADHTQKPPPPPPGSRFHLRPPWTAISQAMARSPHHWIAITAAAADPKATPAFPLTGPGAATFDFALQNAMEYWPGETRWILVGADLLQRATSKNLPPLAKLYRTLVPLLEFSGE